MKAWKDLWKLDVEGHDSMLDLHRRLRQEVMDRWKRGVPFADELFDRWERAAFLGFGKETSIYDSSLVLGDVTVGECTWIGPFSILDGTGGLSIGHHCGIGAGVQIYSHDTLHWTLTAGRAGAELSSTAIGDCCYIGPMSMVNPGVTIGDHVVVAGKSLVREDIPPYSIVAGTPARVIGRIEVTDDDEVKFIYA